jgi:hypothetical protein
MAQVKNPWALHNADEQIEAQKNYNLSKVWA